MPPYDYFPTSSLSSIEKIISLYGGGKCNKNNNYFEKQLANHPMLTTSHISSFPKECLVVAMRKFNKKVRKGSSDRFRICNKKGFVVTKKSRNPPCLSHNYINTVYNSFVNVMSCLDVSPKHIFPLFTVESHFIINSISTTGAVGMGHLVSDTIKNINNSSHDQAISVLKKHKSFNCRNLSTILKKMNPKKRCAAVNIPDNPLANFLYSAINWKTNKLEIAAMIGEKQALDEKEKKYKAKAKSYKENIKALELKALSVRTKRELQTLRVRLGILQDESKKNKQDLKKYRANRVLKDHKLRDIVTELTIYAHNWGAGGVKKVLRSYLKKYKTKWMTYKTFTGKNGYFLKHYLKVSRENSMRKQEKANYIFVGIKKNSKGKRARGSLSTVQREVRGINKLIKGDNKCSNY